MVVQNKYKIIPLSANIYFMDWAELPLETSPGSGIYANRLRNMANYKEVKPHASDAALSVMVDMAGTETVVNVTYATLTQQIVKFLGGKDLSGEAL